MARSQCLGLVPVLLVIALFAARPRAAVAASGKTPVAAVNAANDIGVKGYDPVAYFTLGQPTPGVDQDTYRWKGATYRFASADNLTRVQTEADQYPPHYVEH